MSTGEPLPDNSEPDFAAEWSEITKHLRDIDAALPLAGSGPRDWTPAPEPDEPFDPAQLPDPPASRPHPVWHQVVLGLAIGLVIGTLAVAFGLVRLPAPLFATIGLGAFIFTAGAIFLYLPQHRDPDDDGAHV